MDEKITKTIIVKADVQRVYNAWSNFENFPYFMKNIKTVEMIGPNTSKWEMKGPLGIDVKWEAETTTQEPGKRIGWSTKDREEGNLTTSGQVTFNQLSNDETEIVATVQYQTRAGVAGDFVARLFGDPAEQLQEDLYRFKQYIERSTTATV